MDVRRTRRAIASIALVMIIALGATVGITTYAQGVLGTVSPQPSQHAAPGSPALAAKSGQVIHSIVRTYEMGSADPAVGGPPHADPAYLFPDTIVRESYAVVGSNGTLTRVVTYNKDVSGQVFTQAIIDDKGNLTLYNSRHGLTVTDDAGKPGTVRDVDTRQTNLAQARASQTFQATTSSMVAGRSATVLEDRSAGKRLAFDQRTGELLREEQFQTNAQGQEQLIRSTEWQQLEVLDGAQVPPNTLSPSIPQSNRPSGVPVKKMTPEEAARMLPFSLYTISGLTEPTVAYTSGQHIDLASVPLTYRGLHFAVDRGDAAGFAYTDGATKRYIEMREGPSARFAESLRASQAFWDKANPITVSVDGRSVSGWYLTSTVKTTDKPGSNNLREVPGATFVLLPDVSGTGILMTTQGYSEAELLALVDRLQH